MSLWRGFLGVVSIFGLGLSARAADVYLQERDRLLYFGNDAIELVLDSGSGYFRQIRNKTLGIEHKPADDGAWPFGLSVGTQQQPEQMTAEIRADGVQKVTHRFERRAASATLHLTYPVLFDNRTRKATGVGLGVAIELTPERGYFLVRTEIANGGPLWVTSFYAAKGTLLTGDAGPENEQVRIPTRGGFARSKFQGRSLGLPTYAWGWADYSGQRGGLGIGYVNKDGIQYMFDIRPSANGLEQSWRLFDTRGYWHFERNMNEYQKSLLIQPLEPANNYTTGEWLIIPHAGDWHQTADVYRERFMEVFKSDYQSWEALPERVKRLYVQLGLFVAENSIGNTYPRKVINHLDTVVPQVQAALEAMQIEPNRASVNLVFSHPNVGRYPEFFPVWELAGGDKGMKQALANLHKLGIGYVIGYSHLSYNHRAAKNYVPEADPLDTIPPINPTAGHRACIDNLAWTRLWKDKLIPDYSAQGFDGVYADEGFFPWGTCAVNASSHLHGPTAVGILTGNTRGSLRLHKLLHEGFGPQSVIMVEGSGDVARRWTDASHAYPDPAVAYTLPFKRYIWGVDALTPEPKLSENINVALAHGYALMANLQSGKKIADPTPFRRYAAVRKRLERERAPGYPQGFRDTIGLKWNSSALEARAFRDASTGITVVFYATAPVDADIEVDASKLDFPQLGTQSRHVKLERDEVDLWILRPGSAR